MSIRKHEAVPVDPVFVCAWVKLHLLEDYMGKRSQTHWGAWVERVRLEAGIDREGAESVNGQHVDWAIFGFWGKVLGRRQLSGHRRHNV